MSKRVSCLDFHDQVLFRVLPPSPLTFAGLPRIAVWEADSRGSGEAGIAEDLSPEVVDESFLDILATARSFAGREERRLPALGLGHTLAGN